MSTDSDSGSNKESNLSQLGFVLLLKEEKILLNKSQVPSVKSAKNEAMLRFMKAFEKNYGKHISPEQIKKKKINNMKMELKKKTDKKATGNKKIVLKSWEEELMKLLEADGKNPTLQKIPGCQTTLTKEILDDPEAPETVRTEDDKYGSSSRSSSVMSRFHKRNPSPLGEYETDETKKLSTSELQRLVLLEQLKYIREKRQKLKTDTQTNTSMTSNFNVRPISSTACESENSSYYFNL